MCKRFLFFLITFYSVHLQAQTGIGTTSPAVKLHVKSNGSIFRLEGSDHAYMELFPQGSSTRYGYLGYPGASSTSLTLMNQFSSGLLAFGTNNTNHMWLNSIGKLGIGTSSPTATLTVGNENGTIPGEITLNPTWTSNEGGQLNFKRSLSGSTVDWTIDQFGTSSSDARLRIFGGSSETKGINILENGNVGIGIPAPTSRLHIYDNETTGWWPGLYLDGNSATSGTQIYMRNNNDKEWHIDLIGSAGANPNSLNFWNNVSGSNALSISTDGKINMNTNNGTSLEITANTNDNNGMVVLNPNTNLHWNDNWHEYIMFRKQGSTLGFIGTTTNGTAIFYSSNSDYRLKNDLKNFKGLDLINKMKIYDFAWKENDSRMHGVMAHELQEVVPYAVSGAKDAINSDGTIKTQTVDYSKLTPILIKAIQEQDIKIKNQQQQIDALFKKIELLENKN